MSLPVGAAPADPELSSPPERPFADAPAFLLEHRAGAKEHRSGWAWIEGALWALAAASALFILLAVADRASFTARESRLLEESLSAGEKSRAAGPAPRAQSASDATAAVVGPSRPFLARLEIPAIALSALVVDGVDAQTLRRAVGRIPSSSRPGEGGDVALAGHRDTDFRALGRLRQGDSLRLQTGDGDFLYEVESIRIVAPQRVDVLTPTDHPTLTLVTCYPFHYVGPAPLRYIVRAREVERPSRTTI
ncbi:MAG: class D sortase [Thermoanaerobaculia bacterium]